MGRGGRSWIYWGAGVPTQPRVPISRCDSTAPWVLWVRTSGQDFVGTLGQNFICTPYFFIFPCRVVGLSPSLAAAPSDP
jgi:hypothetical protein